MTLSTITMASKFVFGGRGRGSGYPNLEMTSLLYFLFVG